MPTTRKAFEEQDFLGGRISNKHSIFKTLGMLAYDEAETYAILEFLEWFIASPEADPIQVAKQATIYVGQARFMALTQEITKLSMILGYSKKQRGYNE